MIRVTLRTSISYASFATFVPKPKCLLRGTVVVETWLKSRSMQVGSRCCETDISRMNLLEDDSDVWIYYISF